MVIKISKYRKIIDKIKELGFNEFYQAGPPSKYHELNLVINDNINDIKYWICKSFGKFHIIYQKQNDTQKNSLYKLQHRINCEKNTQKEVCLKFEDLVKRLSIKLNARV